MTLAHEALEVFCAEYLKAYLNQIPFFDDEEQAQAHDEATQEAVEAVVVFVTKKLQGGLSVAA